MKDVLLGLWNGIRRNSKRIALVVGVVLAIAITVDLFFYVSSVHFPKTCTICHYEDSTHQTWKESTHAEVSCSKCHGYKVGQYISFMAKYWSGFYSGHPIVDVKDRSCFKCHSEQILSAPIVFRNNVRFEHSKHYGKVDRTVELRCSSCHTFMAEQGHMAVPLEICYLCHFKGVRRGQSYTGCPSCHGTPEDIVQHSGFVFSHRSYARVGVTCDQCHISVARGTGEVSPKTCRNCHVERLQAYEDAFRLHEIHVGKVDLKCAQCHQDIEHGEMQLVETLEVTCENCHAQSHSGEKEMYMGTGGRGVRDVPSRMFAAQVSCEGCHPQIISGHKLSRSEDLKLKREACVRCHGEGYDRMLDDWERVMTRVTREVRPLLSRSKSMLEQLDPDNSKYEQVKQLIDDANYNYNFVVNGKGVHNVEYAVLLLKSTVQNVQEAMKLVGKPAPAIRDPILRTPDGYCVQFCHHIAKPPKTVAFERMEFPHQVHSEDIGLECTTCHSPEKHKMRVITRRQCMNCHHEQQDLACKVCHPYQQELYAGEIKEIGITRRPDVMAEAEVDCESCHDVSQSGEVLKLVGEMCVACHEEGYDEILFDWHNSVQSEMAEVTHLVTQTRERIEAGNLPAAEAQALRAKVEKAEKVLQILEKAKPVHNQGLATDLLAQLRQELTSSEETGK